MSEKTVAKQYMRGWNAFMSGKDTCSYPVGKKRDRWVRGWKNARHALVKKSESNAEMNTLLAREIIFKVEP